MAKQNAANSFSFIDPMMALRVRELPAGYWLYEMKFDGYRALAFKSGKEVRLLSRNRTLFNDDYPVLVDALKSLRVKDFIIDGEIAALDQNGKSSFQLLQSYGIRKIIPVVYYAFDLLNLVSAVGQNRPVAVEIRGFKTSHFLEQKTAPRRCGNAGPMEHVERPQSEPASSNLQFTRQRLVPAANSTRAWT